MTKRMLPIVRVVLNWTSWSLAKLLHANGEVMAGVSLEAASRMLGCFHFCSSEVFLGDTVTFSV